MNIARGTFRLSIVIALLVAAYYGISGYMAARNSEYENWKSWRTLRCGEQFLAGIATAQRDPKTDFAR